MCPRKRSTPPVCCVVSGPLRLPRCARPGQLLLWRLGCTTPPAAALTSRCPLPFKPLLAVPWWCTVAGPAELCPPAAASSSAESRSWRARHRQLVVPSRLRGPPSSRGLQLAPGWSSSYEVSATLQRRATVWCLLQWLSRHSASQALLVTLRRWLGRDGVLFRRRHVCKLHSGSPA